MNRGERVWVYRHIGRYCWPARPRSACGGVTQSASAALSLASAGDFEVIESCVISNHCSGTFTVVNNSGGDGNWYVYQFDVVNSSAFSDGTTQTNWGACKGASGSCNGNGGFLYYNTAEGSDASPDLANDVGPGQTSSRFTFSSLAVGSPVTIDLVNRPGHGAGHHSRTGEPRRSRQQIAGYFRCVAPKTHRACDRSGTSGLRNPFEHPVRMQHFDRSNDRDVVTGDFRHVTLQRQRMMKRHRGTGTRDYPPDDRRFTGT
jgi:hypothetical protein